MRGELCNFIPPSILHMAWPIIGDAMMYIPMYDHDAPYGKLRACTAISSRYKRLFLPSAKYDLNLPPISHANIDQSIQL